jgi:glycosyltransferase involved in cell wall biosynthesis
MKSLSVVVASQDCAATIGECLASLRRQRGDGPIEIIVVDNSSDGSARIVERQSPGAELIKVSHPSLVPELWARGASRAAGDVVAFTTGHCIPQADWMSEILRHHASGDAGIGGAIENRRPSSISQWATYFARFTPFMLPFPQRPADQIPGDNASYKRFVLEACADLIKDGFWETDVNIRLRAGGHSLLLAPRIVVYHAHHGNVWAFCRQRMKHGRVFGASRISRVRPLSRLLYLMLVPLVPAVILAKIIRRVRQNDSKGRELLLSFPLLLLFVLAWSWGEFLGYLSGLARAPGPRQAAMRQETTSGSNCGRR